MPPLPSFFLLALSALSPAPAATALNPSAPPPAYSERRTERPARPLASSSRGQLRLQLREAPPLALLVSAGVGYAPGPAQWSLTQGSRQPCGPGTNCDQPQHSLMDQFSNNSTVASVRSRVDVKSMDGVGVVWLSPYNPQGYHPSIGLTENGALLTFGGPW